MLGIDPPLNFRCPVCGAARHERCELNSGTPRFQSHVERFDIASDHPKESTQGAEPAAVSGSPQREISKSRVKPTELPARHPVKSGAVRPRAIGQAAEELRGLRRRSKGLCTRLRRWISSPGKSASALRATGDQSRDVTHPLARVRQRRNNQIKFGNVVVRVSTLKED